MFKKIIFLLFFTGISFASELKLIQKFEIETLILKIIVNSNKLYVQTPKELLVYSLSGEEKGHIGAIGEGPGSYQLLQDFDVSKNKIAVADLYNKILIFDNNGHQLSYLKIKDFVDSVFFINDKVYYITKKFIKSTNTKLISQISLRDAITDKEIKNFEDCSKVNAVNPGKKSLPVPWFPNPFFNRLIIFSSTNKLFSFSTREKTFFEINENSVIEKKIEFEFKKEKVTDNDIDNFFKRIESVNKRSYAKETKNSIKFPEEKELFWGVFKWEEGASVITKDELLIFSPKGELRDRIKITTQMKEMDMYGDDLNSQLERRFVFEGKRLYIANSDGFIYVYEIINKH